MVRWLALALAFGGVALTGAPLRAQATDSTKPAAAVDTRDTLFLRARSMVANGNGTAGRAVVDSALAAAEGTPDYGIALYWRAALAATAADAERDYRRVIVEYPFSLHSGDALLALAQLEMARGDRASAIDHLQRYLSQQPPNDPERVRAGISLGRLLLETDQLPKGCAVLLRTRALLGDTAIEIRNQVDYYASRCVGVDTAATAAPAPAAAPAEARSAAPSTPAPTTPVEKPAPTTSRSSTTAPLKRDSVAEPNATRTAAGRYTVQVAAYDTKASAERLVTRLGERGIIARVVGSTAPFRVRVGFYATSSAASEAVRQLKTKGIEGFVATTEKERAAPERR